MLQISPHAGISAKYTEGSVEGDASYLISPTLANARRLSETINAREGGAQHVVSARNPHGRFPPGSLLYLGFRPLSPSAPRNDVNLLDISGFAGAEGREKTSF